MYFLKHGYFSDIDMRMLNHEMEKMDTQSIQKLGGNLVFDLERYRKFDRLTSFELTQQLNYPELFDGLEHKDTTFNTDHKPGSRKDLKTVLSAMGSLATNQTS